MAWRGGQVSALARSDVRAFLFGNALALVGGTLGLVVLTWWIVRDGSAGDLALVLTFQAVLSFVLIPLLAPLGDQWPKRTLLLVAGVVITARAVGLAMLAQSGAYDVTSVILLQCVGSAAMSVILPIRQTALPELVPPALLPGVFGVQKSVEATARTVGPALAALLLSIGGIAFCLWVHVALMALSNIAVLAMERSAVTTERAKTFTDWRRDLTAGLNLRLRIPLERASLALNFVQLLVYLPAVAILPSLALREMGAGGEWLGIVEAAAACGSVVAGLGGAQWIATRLGRFATIVTNSTLASLLILLMGWARRPEELASAFLVLGFLGTTTATVGMTHRLLAVPQAYRVRYSAAAMTLSTLAASIGPPLMAEASAHFGLGPAFHASGLLLGLMTMGSFFVPRLREFYRLDHEAVHDWYAREYPRAFR